MFDDIMGDGKVDLEDKLVELFLERFTEKHLRKIIRAELHKLQGKSLNPDDNIIFSITTEVVTKI